MYLWHAAGAAGASALVGCGLLGVRSELKPSAERQVTLTWLASRTAAEVPVWEGMARAFERKYPNFKIEYVNSSEGWGTKLPALMAAGSGPDLVRLEANGFVDLVNQGFFVDLTRYIQKDAAFNVKDFVPQALDAFKVQGKQYAVPMVFSCLAMSYNPRLFAEAGVPVPAEGWTWDDYLDRARRLTRKEGGQTVQWGTAWETWVIGRAVVFVWQNGGDLFDKTYTRAVLDQADTTDALEWLVNQRLKWGVTPTPAELSATGQNVHGLFMNQKVASIVVGPWQRGIYNGAKDLVWDVAPLPKGKKGDTTALFVGGYPITTQSKAPDDAWVFVRFLTSEESSLAWAKFGTSSPARRSAARSKEFLAEAGPPKNARVYVDYPERAGRPSADFGGYTEVNRTIEAETAPMWRGEAAPRAAAAKATAQANELLRQQAARR